MNINLIKEVHLGHRRVPDLGFKGEYLTGNKASPHVIIPVAKGLPVTLHYKHGDLKEITVHHDDEIKVPVTNDFVDPIKGLPTRIKARGYSSFSVHGVLSLDPIYMEHPMVITALAKSLLEGTYDPLRQEVGFAPAISFNYLYITDHETKDTLNFAHTLIASRMARSFRPQIERWSPLTMVETDNIAIYGADQFREERREYVYKRLVAKRDEYKQLMTNTAKHLRKPGVNRGVTWKGFLVTTNNYRHFADHAFDPIDGHETAIVFTL